MFLKYLGFCKPLAILIAPSPPTLTLFCIKLEGKVQVGNLSKFIKDLLLSHDFWNVVLSFWTLSTFWHSACSSVTSVTSLSLEFLIWKELSPDAWRHFTPTLIVESNQISFVTNWNLYAKRNWRTSSWSEWELMNNGDDNVWTKMKQNDSEFKYNRWVDEGLCWSPEKHNLRKTSLENSRKLMQNMRLSPSGTPSVQLTFAAPSQFDYAGNQPTNQGQSWFLRKIFIASLLRVAFHKTTADFRQLPSCFSFLKIQLKHMETPFHAPTAKTRQNKIYWTEESNNCPLTHKLIPLD